MSKNIRVVSTFILIIFLALFASSTYIQSISATQLQQDPRNIRTNLQSFEVQRGPILVAQTPIASSEPSIPRKSYTRIYHNPELYAHITGFSTTHKDQRVWNMHSIKSSLEVQIRSSSLSSEGYLATKMQSVARLSLQ